MLGTLYFNETGGNNKQLSSYHNKVSQFENFVSKYSVEKHFREKKRQRIVDVDFNDFTPKSQYNTYW